MDSEDDSSPDLRAAKRQKLDDTDPIARPSPLTLQRDISPPPRSGRSVSAPKSTSEPPGAAEMSPSEPDLPSLPKEKGKGPLPTSDAAAEAPSKGDATGPRYLRSPFHLTRVRDLDAKENEDTIELGDLLGDPMIRECWQFNYLFDVDFLMGNLDEDVRELVQVKIVHGSWKKEDGRRIRLEQQAKRYPNVQLITAHMPEAFGTHHCKMMVLIRHDDFAQVIIHTANMIAKDWGNLTQAVWRSPMLPLSLDGNPHHGTALPPAGSGARFKMDLLNYLDAYGSRLGALATQLKLYDFSAIRAAFVASVPCRQPVNPLSSFFPGANTKPRTAWAWPGLKEILSHIPCLPSSASPKSRPSIIMQVSSIATLGQTPKWLDHFTSVLSTTATTATTAPPAHKPTFSLIFPTAAEIRLSLDGYASGASIHFRLHSAAQHKQLAYLRPLLHHWAPSLAASSSSFSSSGKQASEREPGPAGHDGGEEEAAASDGKAGRLRSAFRQPAAPHIKTYIRFADGAAQAGIEWAMLTSANLSTQAWGALAGGEGAGSACGGEARVCSYETGVVVWPALFGDGEGGEAIMVPVFGRDVPGEEEEAAAAAAAAGVGGGNGVRKGDGERVVSGGKTVVGLRMPYDLPLVKYGKEELPWCASADYDEPDWMGVVWKN